jgi:lipocalin
MKDKFVIMEVEKGQEGQTNLLGFQVHGLGAAGDSRSKGIAKYAPVLAVIAVVVCATIGLAVGLSDSGGGGGSSNCEYRTFSRDVCPISNDAFELDAYIGTWYTAWVSRNQLRGGISCTQAVYGLVEGRPDVIRVVNSAENPPRVIQGYATASPESFTILQVNLGASEPEPYAAPNYVIFGLGPKDQNGQYTWSAIAGDDIYTLFLIVRDLDDFAANYEDEALAYVQSFGFPLEGDDSDPGVLVPRDQENCDRGNP